MVPAAKSRASSAPKVEQGPMPFLAPAPPTTSLVATKRAEGWIPDHWVLTAIGISLLVLWSGISFVGAYSSLDSANPNVSSARTTAFLGLVSAGVLIYAAYKDRDAIGSKRFQVVAIVGGIAGVLLAASIDFEPCSFPCISVRYFFILPLAFAWAVTSVILLLVGWSTAQRYALRGKLTVAHLGNLALGATWSVGLLWILVAADGLAENARTAHSQDTPAWGFVAAMVAWVIAGLGRRRARTHKDPGLNGPRR